MKQAALDLVGFEDGFIADASHLIIDRDSKYTAAFQDRLREAGVNPVVLPARSPNLNAHAERFVKSIKTECLDKTIFFSKRSLDRAIREYIAHYHEERNHQGLGNRLIEDRSLPHSGPVTRDKRLGGLLSFYRRTG